MTAPTIGEVRDGSVLAPDGHWHPIAIEEFTGEFGFLSNFARTPFTWGGRTYPTVEHAFQCMKTTDARQREWVLSAQTPSDANTRGRRVQLRDGWDEIRHTVMTGAVRAKFADPQLAGMLVGTGDRLLVEGNRWHDNVWGNCVCGRPACAAEGQNLLGKLLMQIRYDLGLQRVQEQRKQREAQRAKPSQELVPDADLEIPPPLLRVDEETRGRILDTIPSLVRGIRKTLSLSPHSTLEEIKAVQLELAERLDAVHSYHLGALTAASEAEEALIRARAKWFDDYEAECEQAGVKPLPEYRQKEKANRAVEPEREDARRCKLALAYIEERSKVLTKHQTNLQSMAKGITGAPYGGRI